MYTKSHVKKIAQSFRQTQKASFGLEMAAELTGASENDLMVECIKAAILKATTESISENCSAAGARIAKDFMLALANFQQEGRKTKPLHRALDPEMSFAIRKATGWHEPESPEDVVLSDADAIDYCVDSQLVKVVVDKLAQRMMFGDPDVIKEFRSQIKKYNPRRVKPLEFGDCPDMHRWDELLAFLDRAAKGSNPLVASRSRKKKKKSKRSKRK